MNRAYVPPVDRLLALGEIRRAEWSDYVEEAGLTLDDVPELVRMATDEELNAGDPDLPATWGPIHAWRALGQLRAEEAAEPLLALLRRIDDPGDDYAAGDLPTVYGMLGPAAVPHLDAYLRDPAHGPYGSIAAGIGLEEIGTRHPEAREACIEALARRLERHAGGDEGLNGFLISSLAKLKAVEALPLIREAFEQGSVDPWVMGDLEDVEIEMGVREERSAPIQRAPHLSVPFPGPPTAPVQQAPQIPAEWSRIGRNAPCPCGSGQKFKKCCLKTRSGGG